MMAGRTPGDSVAMKCLVLGAAGLLLVSCDELAEPDATARLATLLDPQAEVAEIRRKIFALTDLAGNQERLFEPYPRTLEELVEIYSRNEGGVWCAGAAYTLQQAYQEAGYESWVLSYGFIEEPGYLTHASTLVRVGDEIYLQDAYLNFDYPVPLDEVIASLVARQPITPRMDTAERDVLIADNRLDDTWAVSDLSKCSEPAASDGVRVCRSEVDLELFIGQYMTHMSHNYDMFESLGLPRDVSYLLLFPYGIFDGVSYFENPDQSPLFTEIMEDIRPEPAGEEAEGPI